MASEALALFRPALRCSARRVRAQSRGTAEAGQTCNARIRGPQNPSTGGGRAVRKTLALLVTTTAALGVGAVAVAGSGGGGGGIKEKLTGYEENMAISTPGVG